MATRSLSPKKLLALKSLASAAVGRTAYDLSDRGVGTTTLVALRRAGLVFSAASALTASVRFFLTSAGLAEASRRGFPVSTPDGSFRVLDGRRSVPLAEVRP